LLVSLLQEIFKMTIEQIKRWGKKEITYKHPSFPGNCNLVTIKGYGHDYTYEEDPFHVSNKSKKRKRDVDIQENMTDNGAGVAGEEVFKDKNKNDALEVPNTDIQNKSKKRKEYDDLKENMTENGLGAAGEEVVKHENRIDAMEVPKSDVKKTEKEENVKQLSNDLQMKISKIVRKWVNGKIVEEIELEKNGAVQVPNSDIEDKAIKTKKEKDITEDVTGVGAAGEEVVEHENRKDASTEKEENIKELPDDLKMKISKIVKKWVNGKIVEEIELEKNDVVEVPNEMVLKEIDFNLLEDDPESRIVKVNKSVNGSIVEKSGTENDIGPAGEEVKLENRIDAMEVPKSDIRKSKKKKSKKKKESKNLTIAKSEKEIFKQKIVENKLNFISLHFIEINQEEAKLEKFDDDLRQRIFDNKLEFILLEDELESRIEKLDESANGCFVEENELEEIVTENAIEAINGNIVEEISTGEKHNPPKQIAESNRHPCFPGICNLASIKGYGHDYTYSSI